jgi:hypothetical protein
MTRPEFWFDSNEPDPHEQHILARYMANVPKRQPCAYCPKRATASCGCCCPEHEQIGDTA